MGTLSTLQCLQPRWLRRCCRDAPRGEGRGGCSPGLRLLHRSNLVICRLQGAAFGSALPQGPISVLVPRYKLAVTRRKEEEPTSTSVYNQNDPWTPTVTFADFINNETITNEVRRVWRHGLLVPAMPSHTLTMGSTGTAAKHEEAGLECCWAVGPWLWVLAGVPSALLWPRHRFQSKITTVMYLLLSRTWWPG